MAAEDRTSQILDAVEALLGEGGLDAVTMRAVAARAGVSLRLVQYYGNSKDELLHAALTRLSTRGIVRWRAASDAIDDPTRALESFLLAALPTDEASSSLHRVGVSLELLAITTNSPAAEAYRAHLAELAGQLTELWRRTDPILTEDEAAGLARESMALVHGLGSLVLAGHTTAVCAAESLSEFLDRSARMSR
ncbi:TetR/AcrR family transcriptional regulator [Enemella evansiae]|uniref:TetR/AcrR family transcriptional regulator n=1 Tax=Enemella evansiae TaxID=2016499 RepID=UPI000B968003|nr:TetR/AcrR family transcriptional regulator [Enemella evansiae]OYO03882.1 TetR family transcriptional regulator [Enemella evansiae]